MKLIHLFLNLIIFFSFFIVRAEKVSLRFFAWEGGEGQKILRRALSEFEKENPSIQVKLEAPGFPVYLQKLRVQYAAGAAPDVVLLSTSNFRQFAQKGALLPLTPFLDASPEVQKSQYYSSLVSNLSEENELYLLPRDITPVCYIYYNKRLFKEAGIPFPDGSWTWCYRIRPELKHKDFLWVVEKLTKHFETTHDHQWGLNAYSLRQLADNFAFASGARLADNYDFPKKLLLNSPEMVNAYQFTSDLATKHKLIPTDSEVRGVLQASRRDIWITQRCAMYLSGIWDLPNIRKHLQPNKPGWFDWDITLFPAYKDGKRAFATAGGGYGIISSTKYPKEAWLLVKWLAGYKGVSMLSEVGLTQPSMPEVARSSPWLVSSKTPAELRYPKGRYLADESIQYVHFEPKSPYWSQVNDIIEHRLPSLWNGKVTAQQALDNVQLEAQDYINEQLEKDQLELFNWRAAAFWGLTCLLGIGAWIFWPELIKRNKRIIHYDKSAYLFLLPWILGLIFFVIGPVIFSFIISFSDWDIIGNAKYCGLANYEKAVVKDPKFWSSLRVTLVYTCFSVPLNLITALGLAMLLNVKVKGIALFRTCFYLPSLLSFVVTGLVWRKVFQAEGGLLNWVIYGSDGKRDLFGLGSWLSSFGTPGMPIDWLGNEHTALSALILMSIWTCGAAMLILLTGLQNVPKDYEEASLIEGASSWTRFRYITLPLIKPYLWFCIVTGIIQSFQVFTKAFVMTGGGPEESTRFYILYVYQQAFVYLQMGYASALAWILFVIIFMLTFIQIKRNKGVYQEGVHF